MWKTLIICSLVVIGCQDWNKQPDGAVEQLVEAVIEGAVEQGAAWIGVDVDVDVDFTPEKPESTVRSEGQPVGD